jgi:hypothetical protein
LAALACHSRKRCCVLFCSSIRYVRYGRTQGNISDCLESAPNRSGHCCYNRSQWRPTKERLVFLRWKDTLPGHRAFSEYGPADPRVDMVALKKLCGSKLPSDAAEQNRTWYRLYKSVEHHPAVSQVHKDFLLTRDYTGFAAIFLVIFGATAVAVVQSWRFSLIYSVVLLLQLLIVRHAASTYGIRFTQTVLAEKSAAPGKGRGASAP